jgi:hypothetical protein
MFFSFSLFRCYNMTDRDQQQDINVCVEGHGSVAIDGAGCVMMCMEHGPQEFYR